MKHICRVCGKEVVLPGDYVQNDEDFFHVTCALLPTGQLPEIFREELAKFVKTMRRKRHDTRRND